MPLYLKSHSYGEYVSTGRGRRLPAPRAGLLSRSSCARCRSRRSPARDCWPVREPTGRCSPTPCWRLPATAGCHRCTACFARLRRAIMESAGMMLRATVQFHWYNQDFTDFDEFVSRMNHEKRKKIRQERRRVRDAGISFRWIRGAEASHEDWRFFVECYNRTYRSHHSTPYLNLEFFLRVAAAMPENLLLILGYRKSRRWRPHSTSSARRRCMAVTGARRNFTPAAFRNLLLPGHRVLHRQQDCGVRRRRAGRTQTRARTVAGTHRVGALAGAARVRRRGGEIPAKGNPRHRAICRRTRRAQPFKQTDPAGA